MKGIFITFEGIEGTGKTTQIKLLDEFLQKKGFKTVLTREPGGTTIGDNIRNILLDTANKNMCPLAEFLLYSAGRAQHVEEVIKPALANGKVVLSDRYADASVAYQGAARKVDNKILKQLNDIATTGLWPHLTILIDLEPEIGLKRAKKRGSLDRFEQEDIAFHKRVRDGYIMLAKSEPKRFVILDGNKGVEDLHKDVVEQVLRVI